MYGKAAAADATLSSSNFMIDDYYLKTGLMRRCGYVMPPGYAGVDLILPMLIESDTFFKDVNLRARQNENFWYSYISFRIKTGVDGRSHVSVLNEMVKLQPSLRHSLCPFHRKTDAHCSTCKSVASSRLNLHNEHLAIYMSI